MKMLTTTFQKGAYKSMGLFLNSRVPFEAYRLVTRDAYFIDKTALLGELISALGTEKRFFCITRPRRFGKSVMANMAGAFFGKAAEAEGVFDRLNIALVPEYREHVSRHNVIYIDFSEVPRDCVSYKQYIDRIQNGINSDLAEEYPDLKIDIQGSTWDILNEIFQKTHQSFIFVMDEWDAVFHMPFITKNEQMAYLLFLKSLLKGKAYAELAYMTGVLPITKYSSGSELNMFSEYTMASEERFSAQFGFTDAEVDLLFERYQNLDFPEEHVTRDGLRIWYDGYKTKRGGRVYNPRSVVLSLTNNNLGNYWTSSGPYDELFYYIKGNADAVRDDLALMVSGVSVPSKVREYAATSMNLQTKDEIFSAMVVYGFLNFENGFVSIPNRELMEKFAYMLQKEPSLGYVHRLARESEKMLQATLAMDTRTMCRILEYAHNSETPLLHYNNEAELTAIVNLCYLSARDHYRMEREDKAGTGYVDFIFYPEYDLSADGIILELKVDHTAQEALRQIKEKQYVLRFAPRMGEVQKFTGRILAVGIAYDRQTKHHVCEMEVLKEAASPYRIFHGQSVPYECTGKD